MMVSNFYLSCRIAGLTEAAVLSSDDGWETLSDDDWDRGLEAEMLDQGGLLNTLSHLLVSDFQQIQKHLLRPVQSVQPILRT
jgi:hypothetical protein